MRRQIGKKAKTFQLLENFVLNLYCSIMYPYLLCPITIYVYAVCVNVTLDMRNPSMYSSIFLGYMSVDGPTSGH